MSLISLNDVEKLLEELNKSNGTDLQVVDITRCLTGDELKGIEYDFSGERYLTFDICGGNNGTPDWVKYLNDILIFTKAFEEKFGKSYVIMSEWTDVLDDIYYFRYRFWFESDVEEQ